MSKKIIVTGASGQTGSYMVDYLLTNTDYDVVGVARRSSKPDYSNLEAPQKNSRFSLEMADLSDSQSLDRLVDSIQPSYFINFAAQSFVGASWQIPEQTFDICAMGVLRCLEAIRKHSPTCRFYNAGCHDLETKAMTPTGLKKYTELSVGELVYTINEVTRDLELKPILKVLIYDFEGDLLELKKGGLRITPNHRVIYKTGRNNIFSKSAENFVKLADVKYPNNNPLIGKMLPEFTDLTKYIPEMKKKGNRSYGKHIGNIHTYDLMYLIGLYIGDGSCRILTKNRNVSSTLQGRMRDDSGQYAKNREDSKMYEVTYSCPQAIIDIPSKDEAFEKLTKTLDKNEIRWKKHGQCDVTFHQWGLNSLFSECGHSASTKKIPNWIFELDHSYQEKVLEGIIDSDGDDRGCVSTTSPKLQQDLIKLHINCGKMPSIYSRPPREAKLKDGRIIKGKHPEYTARGLKRNRGYQRGNFNRIPYKGKVWCLEVKDNHNFLVERSGKMTFSGNSSEEFGDVMYSPQDMKHPARARSIYGASKIASRQIIKVYRESYKMYAIQGLLFNHECLTAKTPIFVKNKKTGLIDIVPIEEIVPHRTSPSKGKRYTTILPCDWEVWDGDCWSEIKTRTATWNDARNDKKIVRISSRGGLYEATQDHLSFKEGAIEVKTGSLKKGDLLEIKKLPCLTKRSLISAQEAEFLGLMTAEGFIDSRFYSGRFTNKDVSLCERIKKLWQEISLGHTSEYFSKSGYTGKKDIKNINLLGDGNLLRRLRSDLYTNLGEKRVPQRILNSSKETIQTYLEAYNMGDGLKAGRQKTIFKGFTTNSYCLASGLIFICDTLGFRTTLCPEERGGKLYFKINVNSLGSKKGAHLIKNNKEITKVSPIDYVGWLFDLETKSKTFSAGVGKTWVHNSERRGEEFVTRKITKGVTRIKKALLAGEPIVPIELGYIDAKRDWSHAEDFVDGVWRMLNQENHRRELEHMHLGGVDTSFLKEYILASGETHSIREFITKAFIKANIFSLSWHGEGVNEVLNFGDLDHPRTVVKINPKFYRPAEVDLLQGDSSEARAELGWKPKVSFDNLVSRMIVHDLNEYI